MVEEMYTEEMKGQEKQQQQGGKEETNNNNNKGTKRNGGGGGGPTEKPMTDGNNSPTADNISSTSLQPPAQGGSGGGGFSFINTLNMENNNNNNNSGDDRMVMRNCGKKPRNDAQSSPRSSIVSVDMDDMKSPHSSGGGGGGGYSNRAAAAGNFPDLLAAAASTSGFGGFPIGDFGRPFSPENLAAPGFHGGHNNNNNGSVSLTLGLPPSENQQNYLSTHQDMELGRRMEMGRMGIESSNNNSGGYESIDFESAGKRFAAQLLPDFVA